MIDCVARGATRIPALTVNVSGQTLEDAEFLAFVAGEPSGATSIRALCVSKLTRSIRSTRLGWPPFAATSAGSDAGLIDSFGRRSVTFNALTALQASFVKVDGSIVRRILTTPGAANKVERDRPGRARDAHRRYRRMRRVRRGSRQVALASVWTMRRVSAFPPRPLERPGRSRLSCSGTVSRLCARITPRAASTGRTSRCYPRGWARIRSPGPEPAPAWAYCSQARASTICLRPRVRATSIRTFISRWPSRAAAMHRAPPGRTRRFRHRDW